MNPRLKYLVVSTSTGLVLALLFGATRGQSANNNDQPYKHLAVFSEVLSRIKSEYVQEPDLKGVTAGAINGLIESVDPFGSYLSSDQYKQYLKKDGKKGSIGLSLARRVGYVSIVATAPGSPASKSALSTGDLIEAINGVATRDMPLAYAEFLLQGDPGSSVELTVLRLRNPDPQKISLQRAEVKFPDVMAKMQDGQIGLIQTSALSPNHVKQAAAKVAELEKQGAKKLILDLRSCAFGQVEEGIALANLFVDKGLLTYLQGQKYPRQDFAADAAKAVTKLPLLVLTNRGTSGGAEVAAAALLDSKRAEVVGERTYGSAALRKAITLDDGAAVILAVAKYYGPAGKSLPDNGVVPTYPTADTDNFTDDDAEEPEPQTPRPDAPKPEGDSILKKALEVFAKK
jgi:carboxyl-terminal processing protease